MPRSEITLDVSVATRMRKRDFFFFFSFFSFFKQIFKVRNEKKKEKK